MKGSPLLRTAVVVAVLLLLMLPLRSLTNARATAAAPAVSAPSAPANVRLTVTSTSIPFQFQVSHLGQTIWVGNSSDHTSFKTVTMAFPPEGVDLTVQASWQTQTEGAIRLDVTAGDRSPISRTLWGTGEVDDVLTFGASG